VIVAIGHVYAQLPRREVVEQAMLTAQREAREQDGCMLFSFAEVLGEAGHFLVVQRWRDQGALEEHYRSDSFAAYQAAMRHQLVRDSDLQLHVVAESVSPLAEATLDLDQDD
jgi:quinol monooxygenase YgiN